MSDLKNILLNIGAVAGFAGIVALAVLALLYFAQARDVRRLREWAGREPERAAEVELRAQQIASQAIAQVYEAMEAREAQYAAQYGAAAVAAEQTMVHPPPAGAEEPEPATGDVVVAVEPGEGVADGVPLADGGAFVAPGEQSLEEEHPDSAELAGAASGNGHVENGHVVAEPPPGSAATGDAADEAEGAPATPDQAPSEPVQGDGAPALPDRPAPGDAVAPGAGAGTGTGTGTGEFRPSRLAPSTPAAARGGVLPPLPPLDTSEFVAMRPPGAPAGGQPSTETTGAGYYGTIDHPPPPEEPVSRRPFVIAGVLVAIFTGLLIYSLADGSKETPQQTAAQKREQRDARRTATTGKRNPQINRPAVDVTVLNGTSTSGLAKLVADQLVGAGFSEPTTGNRNDGQNHVSSVVFYKPGSKLEAEEVAKEIDIKSVREIDAETEAVGGSAPVVVVLGADIEQ